jgi:predicted ribosomally synthesized peptide with SipW-like signal peptide
MNSRKVGIALLVMLAFVVTTGTFAYWASSVSGPANDTTVGTVTVGEGNAVTTSFTLTNTNATGGDLVPAAQLANSAVGAVDSVTLVYDVQWVEDVAGQLTGTTSTAPLTVTTVVTLEDSLGNPVVDANVLALIVVTPDAGNAATLTLGAAASSLSFVVTMTEPANSAEYDLIANGTITITFTYSLGTVTTTDN